MKRRIEVVHTAVEINGEMTYGTPKTHQCRSVPLPRSLVDALAEHVPAAKQIGKPGLTPHDLRHTAASLAVQVGAEVSGATNAWACVRSDDARRVRRPLR